MTHVNIAIYDTCVNIATAMARTNVIFKLDIYFHLVNASTDIIIITIGRSRSIYRSEIRSTTSSRLTRDI